MVGFKYGNFVRLQGLSNAAYNGKLAIVSGAISDDGRYLAKLQDEDDEVGPSALKRVLRIKSENLAHA